MSSSSQNIVSYSSPVLSAVRLPPTLRGKLSEIKDLILPVKYSPFTFSHQTGCDPDCIEAISLILYELFQMLQLNLSVT